MLVNNVYCPINHPLQFSYSPGHCWFYRFNTPLSVKDISKSVNYAESTRRAVDATRAKDKRKRREKIVTELAKTIEHFEERVERYNELLKGPTYHEVEAWNNDRFMSWAMAMSLVHNHISYYGGVLGVLATFAEMPDEKLDVIYNSIPK